MEEKQALEEGMKEMSDRRTAGGKRKTPSPLSCRKAKLFFIASYGSPTRRGTNEQALFEHTKSPSA
jgi:hypothetical protein